MVNYNFNRLCFAQSHEYNRLCECRIYTYTHTYLYVCPPKATYIRTLIIIALGLECADFFHYYCGFNAMAERLSRYVGMCSSMLVLRG